MDDLLKKSKVIFFWFRFINIYYYINKPTEFDNQGWPCFIHNFFSSPGTFFTYSGFSILGIIFVQMFIEETKNKTLAQIQDIYQQKFERVRPTSSVKLTNGTT